MILKDAATDVDFWAMVADMDWAGNGFDYDAIGARVAKRLVDEYGVQQAADISGRMHRALMMKEWALRRVICRHPAYKELYGDSLDDLVAHIVGLGQGYYEQVMADAGVAKNLDYRESFAYCFHAMDEIGRTDAAAEVG